MGSIGIFDSGLGGLSVWREVRRLLPTVPLIYVADSGRCPYGSRSPEQVQAFSRQITAYLLDRGCSLIVVACNTATAAAIELLRAEFSVPFVGMEPALKPAVKATQTGVVGILATRGTFLGDHFQRTRARYAGQTQVLMQEGQGLVEWVEAGRLDDAEVEAGLRRYLEPMLVAGADQIVLGCSHYPFLRPVMQRIAGTRAHIVDPAPAVARQAQRLWEQAGLQPDKNRPLDTWVSSADPQMMTELLRRLRIGEAEPTVVFHDYQSKTGQG